MEDRQEKMHELVAFWQSSGQSQKDFARGDKLNLIHSNIDYVNFGIKKMYLKVLSGLMKFRLRRFICDIPVVCS